MNRRNVESILPLTPVQEGMLFHALETPHSGVYVGQLSFTLEGVLDVGAFRSAWERLIERHTVLRTAFVWEGVERPVQVVMRRVELPLETEDWRPLPMARHEERFAELARRELTDGLAMDRAPLLRLRLVRTGERRHRLLWFQHHAVLDGWSLALLLEELLRLYALLAEGEGTKGEGMEDAEAAAAGLPRRRPYRDYLRWLKGRANNDDEAFWRRQLAGFEETTPLPVAPPVGSVATERHDRARLLPGKLATGLESLVKRGRLTLNVVVQAAWALVLARGVGRRDVVFGVVVSGRPPELEGALGMVGMFINTLPLRVEVEPRAKLGDWLSELHARQAAMQAHEHTPLADVRRWSALPPRAELFESIIACENYPVEQAVRERRSSLVVRDIASRESAHYPLVLMVVPGMRPELRVSADPTRLDATAATRVLARLEATLEGMVRCPEARLGELPTMSAAERQQVVGEWNDRRRCYPRQATLRDFFEGQAAAHPERSAMVFGDAVFGDAVFGDATMTYGELDVRANRLAHRLRSFGIGPEIAVGLLLERGPDLVTAILAVVKAGGVYVPLDADYPTSRLRLMTRDLRMSVVISEASQTDLLGQLGAPRVLLLDRERHGLGGESPSAPPKVGGADNLAYVMYTSGSTGRPKGVMVPQRAVVRLVRAVEYADLGPNQVFLQLSPVSFDASTLEVWGALAGGGRLVLHPPGPISIRTLVETLSRHRVSTLWLTAGLFHSLVEEDVYGLQPVRQLLAGGDALSLPHIRRVLEELPGTELINGYGPTENTTFSCCHLFRQPPVGPVPIGRPIHHSQAWVLGPELEALPIGAAGELHVGGDGLARGYDRQPALTARGFLPCAFAEPGQRMYATGDRSRWLVDGTLEFLGRLDFQVKVRGFRIELGEIEAVLEQHPRVAKTVVTARQTASGERQIVAYVVARGTLAEEEPREYLDCRLPAYMVPAFFVFLDRLPLGTTGKVDRGALPDPAGENRATHVPPSTPTEEMMAGIWATLLEREKVGRGDDFFDLGGHSLLATQAAARASAAFGVELGPRLFFEHSILAAMAAEVDRQRTRRAATAHEPIRPRPRGSLSIAGPLSFAQERLWFLHQLGTSESAAYHVSLAVEIDGELRPEILTASLAALAERHEAFRTRFESRDGQPAQCVEPSVELPLPVVDLERLDAIWARRPTPGWRGVLHRWGNNFVHCPFDLERAPLARALLLRRDKCHHALLLNLHHIITDGWSMGIVVRELAAAYGAFAHGQRPFLPALPVSYVDFTAWQRQALSGEHLDRELHYWRSRLTGAPATLELPFDRPRTAARDFRGAAAAVRLVPELHRAVENLARKRSATLFMLLLAAFDALLARLTGQRDLVVGTPVAHRTRPEIENVVGFFVNTLTLRLDLRGDPTFAEILARARETALDAYDHQDLPFEKLVEELAPRRDLSHTPLFQVILSLENTPRSTLKPRGPNGELRLTPLPLLSATAKFDLTLNLAEADGSLAGGAEYATDLFDRTTILRFLRQFRVLLEATTSDSRLRLSELPLLPLTERRQVLGEWNDSSRPYPHRATLGDLFEEQAAAYPDRMAVVFGGDNTVLSDGETLSYDETLSYGELNTRANRLARHLLDLGVGPEVAVGLLLERCLNLVTATLAIIKAGGYYVPLDADYPISRLRWMVADSRMPLVISESAQTDLLTRLGVQRTVLLDRLDRLDLGDGRRQDPQRRDAALNLAYVMFTSGSTGRPKGVAVPQRAVIRLVRDAEFADLGPSQVFLQLAPISFDASTLEIWGALANGGRLVLHEPGPISIGALVETLKRHRVSTLWLTAGLFHRVVEEDVEGLRPLRQLLAGGDVLSVPHIRRVLEELPATRLINGYGPTENTTFSNCHLVRRSLPGSVPIGRPIQQSQVWVLGSTLEILPIGVAGELHVAGDGLARGYERQPSLTAERFLPCPLGAPGRRMYATGDLGRWLTDGTVEFLGRLDFQVKIRGFRIELGEIESLLETHPGVSKTVVVAREIHPGDRQIVAYVVPRSDLMTEAELREILRARLPDYMVPAFFVLIDSLPLGMTGKVDRGALPRPVRESHDDYAAPSTPTEEMMAGIWAALFDLEKIGRDDDFFDLGGHSLLATQAASRASAAFELAVGPRLFFEHPTLAAMAAEIDRQRTQRNATVHEPIRLLPRPSLPADVGPLSFAQERMWFLHQLTPGAGAYHSASALLFRGRLDIGVLRRVMTEIARRHEVLRTAFPEDPGGRPVQRIAPPEEHPLPLADLTRLDEDASQRQVLRRLRHEGRQPFDMALGPLFRAVLLRRDDKEHILLIAHHHVVFDGWSFSILLREVGTLYRAFLSGQNHRLSPGGTPPLPPLPIQYADYAAWQRGWLDGEVFERELAHWRRLLEPMARVAPLPVDRPRPEDGRAPAGRVILNISDESAAALRHLARSRGATLFMVLLAAWNALLHRLTGALAVVVGTPIAGRNRVETEGLIGFFINTLVLCTDLEGDPTFTEILARVRTLALEAYGHQEVPYERLVEELRKSSTTAAPTTVAPTTAAPDASPFQVMFAVQNFPMESLELPGVELAPAEIEAPEGVRSALFDLMVTMADRDGVLRGNFEYNAAIFDQATIEALSGHFLRLLDEVTRDPERRVAELLPLEAAEEQQWRRKAAMAAMAIEVAEGKADEEAGDPRQREEKKEKLLKAKVAQQRGQLSAAKRALLQRRLRGAKGRGKKKEGVGETSARRQAIPKRPPGEAVPLSYSQERLWFLEQLEPGTTTYTMPMPLRLRGRIDPAKLAVTFDELLRRHEVLRTRYESHDDQPVQVIDPPGVMGLGATRLPLIDLTGLATSERAAGEARRLVAAQSARPFDLERGPVLRAALLRLDPEHHVLVCSGHHIALDGWSVGLLVRDLTMIYEAVRAGRPSPLPDLPVQYADYSRWQREWLSGEILERQIGYWVERLGDPRPLELPADRPRPPVRSFRGEVVTQELSGELSEKIRDLSRQAEATLFVALLAAFKVLLGRLGGVTDVTVGTPIAGRGQTDLEGMIGLFLNTLVLRTDLSGRPSFRQLLGRVRETALGAYSHQDVPFEKLLEVLRPERDLSRTPLFQVFFNMLNLPPTEVRRPDFQVELVESTHVQSKFDLTVYVQDRPRGLSCSWVYNADLFDSGRIAAMLGQFEGVLRQVTDDPDIPIEQISLLPAHGSPSASALPDPTRPLSDAWHGAVHEIFADWARREPARTAVIDDDRIWSYGELAARARRLAEKLRMRGTGRGDVVAIWAVRRAELVAALLGVLESGAAFLILDPVHPLPRHRACLGQAAPRVFLELEAPAIVSLAGQVPPAGQVPDELKDFLDTLGTTCLTFGAGLAVGTCLATGTDLATGSAEPRSPQLGAGPRTHPFDLACMVFTSGSTGTPKGVLGRHSSLSHFIPWKSQTFDLSADDRYSLLSGLPHDPLQRDIFTPLQLGAAVCVPPAEVFEVPGRLAVWLREADVTIAHLTPAMVQLLAEGDERLPQKDALRWAFVTGEALTALEVERLRGASAKVRVVNSYGSTETQRSLAYYQVPLAPGAALPGAQVLPLGRGAEGVQLLVLGVGGALAGTGEVGEISMRGHHLALGYLDDPALTARRFVPHPLGGTPGERVYLTGDLGRYRPDGLVTFTGRADRQVQVRGYRVEPGEIEAVLRRHSAVREAVVVQHHRKSSPDREAPLIAWIVPESVVPESVVPEAALTLDVQALRGHLAERLPSYMVPSAFVALERLPLTPSRKFDRSALARRPLPAPSAVNHVAAPRTPAEEVMLEIWREVLGGGESVVEIGVDENFFELGGHSILATRLMARIGRAFGVTPPLRRLFEAPTVAALTAVVERERGRGTVLAELPPVVPDLQHRHEPFPLTDVQQAYWVGRSGAFEIGNVATHSYQELELDNLDTHRLELAWRRLVARHDMLRAVILPDGRQKILRTVPEFEIRHLDLRGRPPAEVEATLGALRQELSHQVLDTATWPLFDLRVTLLDGGRARFHLSRDLLIYDAFSSSILQRELGLFYFNPEAVIEPLELSFRDYVLAEEALRQSELHRRSEAYWHRRLASLAPAPELPLAIDPAALARPRFERRRGRLDAETWSVVKRQGKRLGLTPSVVLLAAWARVLAAYSKASRFTLNLTLFNRLPLHPQVQRLVGDFTSLILLEVDTRPDSFSELARRVQEQLWDDLDHRTVSGVWVQRELRRRSGGTRRTGMPIVFTSTLVLDTERATQQQVGPAEKDQAISDADAATLGGGSVFAISQTSQVWLDHQVGESNGQLGFNWDSVAGLFPAGLLDAMFDTYRGLLADLATEAGWLETHPVLVPAAQLALYREVNDTARPVPEGLLHGPFLARAAECPHAIAVLDAERHLTYGQLHLSSGRFAHVLHGCGVGPGELVAVVMDKGWEQIVAVLAILRAGAAYLPIDPELPAERIRHLLARSRAEHALTQSHRHEELSCLGDPESGKPYWWAVDSMVDSAAGQELSADTQPADPDPASPEDLAYIIFTSGSTGLPKGVMIEHRSALNTILDVNQRFAVTARDKVLALSSLSFDLSVYDIFGLLAAGGTIVLPGRAAGRRDPAHWFDLVTNNGVTLWNTVPALMQMYTEHALGQHVQAEPNAPASPLRRVMMSGDWIPVHLPERIRRLGKSLEVVSLGGATEASIWSILYPIGRVGEGWPSIPYGRAMVNQSFHVLDVGFLPRPVWVPGELYIGGIGLARGYFEDQEQTTARFLIAPQTTPLAGQRLYRTGDLGRYLPDGNIEFLGREDFQVKIQGYRIELGEIESALVGHPAVRDAVVLAVGETGPGGSRRLVACFVPEANGEESTVGLAEDVAPEEIAPALDAYLREKIPPYMVPSSFHAASELPLTANGKVDRAELARRVTATSPGGTRAEAHVAPRNPREAKVAAIWAEILEVEQVGVYDNFYELGGDSIHGIRIVTRANEEGIPLSSTALFEHQTVAQLIASLDSAVVAPALVKLRQGGAGLPLFCVHAAGGNVFNYRPLAEILSAHHSVYGLQARGFSPGEEPRQRVEEMAVAYLEEVRTINPNGPYALLGWSFGGLVAFEMARQVLAEGGEMAFLGILDTAAVSPALGDEPSERELLLMAMTGRASQSAEELRQLDQDELLELGAGYLRQAWDLAPDFGVDGLRRYLEVYRTNGRAWRAYEAPPYFGHLTLFRASQSGGDMPIGEVPLVETPSWRDDETMGWGAVASGGVEVQSVPGSHGSVLRPPNVEALAEYLRKALTGKIPS